MCKLSFRILDETMLLINMTVLISMNFDLNSMNFVLIRTTSAVPRHLSHESLETHMTPKPLFCECNSSLGLRRSLLNIEKRRSNENK